MWSSTAHSLGENWRIDDSRDVSSSAIWRANVVRRRGFAASMVDCCRRHGSDSSTLMVVMPWRFGEKGGGTLYRSDTYSSSVVVSSSALLRWMRVSHSSG